MSDSPAPSRRLAAVWFADIVGYTTLSSQDEDGAHQVVAMFQRLADEIVPQHGGRVVKYIGDAALAEFASTDGAIRSALALMERYTTNEAAARLKSTLRIGVNVGEIITSADGDIYGDGVNLASRLQNQASPGQVIASEAVHAQIRQRTVFRTEPLGQRAVKGIADPVNLYKVSLQEAGEGPVFNVAEPPASAGAGRSKRTKIFGGIALAVVAVVALFLLDPGGMVSRLTSGSPVSATGAAYPVVEGGMEVGAAVTVSFSGALDPSTATSQNVQLLDAEHQPVPAEVALGADRRSVAVRPRSPLAFAGTYTLVLGSALRDDGGRIVTGPDGSEGSARFTIQTQAIPAGTPPASARIADDGAVGPGGPVSVAFSEAMDPRTVSGGGVRITDAQGDSVAADVQFAGDLEEARLSPSGSLTRGARYTVWIDSTVLTARGLHVQPETLSFHVALPSRPAVESTRTGEGNTARAQPSARSAPATGPATLNLSASPAAARAYLKVVVDGDTLGPPPVKGRALAEGRSHTISIVGIPDLSAYTLVVYRHDVTPQPGQVLNLSAEITAFGSIDVVSEPAGTVFVDGRQVGRTPLAGYPVTAGLHRLEIRPTPADSAGFGPFTGEFRVGALEWKSLGRLALPPKG